MENKGVVYTLQLENGCYYVGWSKCFESLGFRLGYHFTGQGAAWVVLLSAQQAKFFASGGISAMGTLPRAAHLYGG